MDFHERIDTPGDVDTENDNFTASFFRFQLNKFLERLIKKFRSMRLDAFAK